MDEPLSLSVRKHETFFRVLAETGLATKAVSAAGMDYSHAFKRRREDPEFAERWEQALDDYASLLEAEAHRRAVVGTDKGVWHQGVQVGTERQYSDSLLALMLKAKRKREYGDSSKVELTGADGGPVKVEDSPTQSARKIAFALALGLKAAAEQLPDGSDLG